MAIWNLPIGIWFLAYGVRTLCVIIPFILAITNSYEGKKIDKDYGDVGGENWYWTF
jgi:dipeptidase